MPDRSGERVLGEPESAGAAPSPGSVRYVGVRERVVAELEALPVQAAHEVRMPDDLAADDEEGGGHVQAAQLGGDPRRPARIWPVVERERDAPPGRHVPGLEAARAPGEDGSIARERAARCRDRRRAPPSGARRQALDREQGQQREEEQPEDDPAGDGPRRFAQVRPSSAAVEAEAALRPSLPGRAERRASAQAAASCGRPDGLGSWPEAVAARPSGAALAAPGSPYAPSRECAVRG